MTGNRPGRSGNPAKRANPGLDQLAAQIRNDRKGGNPLLVPLAPLEQQVIEMFARVGGDQVDPAQAGATSLILGQLFADLVPKLPPEQQELAPAIIINLMRMIGQRLYEGDLPVAQAEPEPEPELRCPFVLPHGAPCRFAPKPSMGGTLTTVMQGHVALHHPGEVWPPAEDGVDEGTDLSEERDDEVGREARHREYEARVAADRALCGDEDEPYSEFHATNFPAVLRHPADGCAFDPPCAECQRRAAAAGGDQADADATPGNPESWADDWANERPAATGGELVFDPELLAAADATAPTPAELVCEACLRPVVLATVNDEQLLAFRFEAHGDGAVLCVECIAALPTPTREAVEQIIRDETSARESAGELMGACPVCTRIAPLDYGAIMAPHMIEGAHIQCDGTGMDCVGAAAPLERAQVEVVPPVRPLEGRRLNELLDAQQSGEPSPWAPPGPRTFHPNGTVTCHEQPPTPWQCPHPARNRMRLPGGERCSACGGRVDQAEPSEQTPVVLAGDGVWPELPPGATFTGVQTVDDPNPVAGQTSPVIGLRRDADGRPVEVTAEVPEDVAAKLRTDLRPGNIATEAPGRGAYRFFGEAQGFDLVREPDGSLTLETTPGYRSLGLPEEAEQVRRGLYGADGQPIRPDDDPGDIDGA